MPRFYVDLPLIVGQTFSLPDRVIRHLNVLRLTTKNDIVLFNGNGGEFKAHLLSLTKRDAQCYIERFVEVSRESPLSLSLAQSIASHDRMDFILQKGVEMGVHTFQPILSARSAKLPSERIETRMQRWKEIICSACEQCGRNLIPEIHPIIHMTEWLALPNTEETRLILSPSYGKNAQQLTLTPSHGIWLMVGPEGGFSKEEEGIAITAGWQPLRLGPRILRTETAALASIATLEALWGDLAKS